MIPEMSSRGSVGGVESTLADLIEEFIDRRRAGEPIEASAFAAEHPEHAEALRDLIPTLAVVDELAHPGRLESDTSDTGWLTRPGGGRIGEFRVLREIGRGGMGVVFEAEQVTLGRRVALKILPWAGHPDDRQLARFQSEACAVAALDHPHIVPLFATGYERGVHYLAMRLIAGRSLAQLIASLRGDDTTGARATGVGPAVSARLGLQAAEALDHAHGMGILHRDVKPANLLVDDDGHLWVVDFGLARIPGRGELTASGDVIGTLRYTSPEQAAGRRLLDQRTDIYALGATLYELLTLRPPFDGPDRHALMRQIAEDEPLPPRRLDPAVPRDLETIVLKAMARDPQARYETARELADDLRCFLSDRTIRARRPGLPEWAARWARRHRTAMMASVAVAALALAGLAAGTILLWRERGRTSHQQAQTRENLGLALEALDHFGRAAVEGDYSRDPERAERVEALQLDAIRLYTRLIRQNPGDRWTRLRAAQAYHRLANIRAGLIPSLSDRFRPSLSDRIRPAEAEEAFGEASALLAALSDDDPADPACREESGRVLSDWAWFQWSAQLVGSRPKAEPTLRKALAIQDRLAAEFAGVPRYRLALSQTYVRLSYFLYFNTRPAEVEDVLRRALSLRRELPGDSPGSLEGIAEIHGRLGHFMLTRRRVAEGVRSLDQALTMLDNQVQRDRSDPSRRRALAELYTRICCPSLCSPELTDTLAPYFLKAVKAWEAVVDDFPGVPDFQEGLSTAWVQDSSLMREAGRIPDATSALRRSVDVMERLCAQHPTVRRYRRHLAGLHLSMARLLDESDHPEAALPELERSLELGSDDFRTVSDIAQWLAVCPDPGGRGPTRAAELALRLLAEKPENGALWRSLGLSRAKAGDWPAAVAALERAVSFPGYDDAARLALAVAYWHSGNEPMARKYYDASIVAIESYERSSHRPRAQGGYLRRLQDQAAALLDPPKFQGGRP